MEAVARITNPMQTWR